MINKVILEGRLVKDVEIRYTQNNKPVASYSIALNRGKDKNGNDLGCDFISVVSWDKAAEMVNTWFKKGDGIAIEGRLQQRTWEDNGVKKSVTEVVTEKITFPEGKKVTEPTPTTLPTPTPTPSTFNVGSDDLPF